MDKEELEKRLERIEILKQYNLSTINKECLDDLKNKILIVYNEINPQIDTLIKTREEIFGELSKWEGITLTLNDYGLLGKQNTRN